MSTLEAIKEQYAKEQGFGDFYDFEYNAVHFEFSEAVNEISKRYASQQVKEALEEAAEKAEIEITFNNGEVESTRTSVPYSVKDAYCVKINKESILSIQNKY